MNMWCRKGGEARTKEEYPSPRRYCKIVTEERHREHGSTAGALTSKRRTEVRAVRVVYQGRRSSAVLPLVLNWVNGRSDGKAPLALAALILGASLVVSISAALWRMIRRTEGDDRVHISPR